MSVIGKPILTGIKIGSASGPIAHWTDGVDAPLKSLLVNIDPVQDLHGYDNPWPAGGGKNLYNKDGHNYLNGYVATEYIKYDGTAAQPTSGNWQTSEYIPIMGGLYYTISGLSTTDSNNPALCYYDSDKTFISGVQYANRARITNQAPANAAYVRLSIGPTATTQNVVQYEQSSSATTYAPYSNICPISGWDGMTVYHSGADTSDPTTYPITWQSAGTVYGGTLDVTNGVLTITHGFQTFVGDITEYWYYLSLANTFYIANPSMGKVTDADGICNMFNRKTNWNVPGVRFGVSSTYVYFMGLASVVGSTDPSVLRSWLSANPLQIAFALATPIEYTLTPQQISSLLGENNIWADTGDVDAAFIQKSLSFIS